MSLHPGLVFSVKGDTLMATLRPLAQRPVLDSAALKAALLEAGYVDWHWFDDALVTLIDRYNTPDGEFNQPIGTRQNTVCTIEIAPGDMEVWATTLPSEDLSSVDIMMALGDAGVTYGVDAEAIKAMVAAGKAMRVRVAAGLLPQAGEDSRFELLVPEARDRTPQVNEKGLIDFREQGAIPTVSAEQPLMRRIPATQGIEGRNVRGEVILPQPGRNESFRDHLVGAYVSKEDSNLLLAVFSGQPVCFSNGVNVEQVLHLKNVNMASGNITFDGTVHVAGEVMPGMKINATGDIVVGETVDGAELHAGGDIRVGGGIIAKTHVVAGGSVSMRFAEGASIHAGATIAVEDSALQCELQANNQILVGTKQPQRGLLSGGSARAMMLIKAPLLGSGTGGVTTLTLGVNPELEARYFELLKKIDHARETEENLGKIVKLLAKQGDKTGKLERANASWQESVKVWGLLLPERDALEKEKASILEAKVEVTVGVSGAVDLSMCQKVLRVRQNYDAGTFMLDGDRIVFVAPGH